LAQGYAAQGYAAQGYAAQGYAAQSYAAQGYAVHRVMRHVGTGLCGERLCCDCAVAMSFFWVSQPLMSQRMNSAPVLPGLSLGEHLCWYEADELLGNQGLL